MFRAEIIANRSIEDELIEALEARLPEIRYTLIPDVHGRGKENRKLGTVTWPELNFVMFAYIGDSEVESVRGIVTDLRERFPGEGIKLFMVPAIE